MEKDKAKNPVGSKVSEPTAIAEGAHIMPGDYDISLAAKGGADTLLRDPRWRAPAAHARL